ncbi:hypothetical protein [Paenibacillus sp. UNC451MF]|uniref:hypothetical protein n=1 Tax=Paenibacillus sp. UNC451MF TaxID=1449063 RepID=UPI00048F0904|nr:hypothetical protein [Paenibacillus sp. UNC451MF]
MREKSLLGYNPRKVERYFSALEAKEALLDEQLREEEAMYKQKEAELLGELTALRHKIDELDQLETGLKQWIQRNRN